MSINNNLIPVVGILMGSKSDLPVIESTIEKLREFGIQFEIKILSAHRTPHLAMEYASSAESRGLKVIIAAAGGAAHLAGVIAAHTILPVIGIPIESTPLNGLDSLLSIVQMPAGVPVATVAIGKSGASNAAILAAQIIGISDKNIANKLKEMKKTMADNVISASKEVEQIGYSKS